MIGDRFYGSSPTTEWLRYPPKWAPGRRRRYQLPSGKIVPAIATILRATEPESDRFRLHAWRKKVGYDKANQIARSSSQRGRDLHLCLEEYLLGQPFSDFNEDILPWWNSLKTLREQIEASQLIEGMVFHGSLNYAGTADAILTIRHHGLCLCDWKTSKSWKKPEWLTNYKLQIAALWGAIQSTYGVTLEKALLAIALPEEPAQLEWIERDELEWLWEQWLERLAQWKTNS